ARRKLIEKACEANLPVVVWTVDDANWVERARALGLYALISNQPAQLLAARWPPPRANRARLMYYRRSCSHLVFIRRSILGMPVKKGAEIASAKGKLGVLLVGLGAVSTTFIAGVEAIKEGLAEPIGSLTQMGTIRLGKRTDNRVPAIKDFVPLAKLSDLVFGAWDIFPDSAYDAAMHAGLLEKNLLAKLKNQLQKSKPMKAVFDQSYVKRLNGSNVKSGKNKLELAHQLIEEIAEFKKKNRCDRLVMIWAASTEIFMRPHAVHRNLQSFEQAMRDNHKA